jgi:GNAT superfamily N-acetyltransferase
MTPPYFFDERYLEHATLRDGTEVRLRLLRPDDKQLLREGFERLSPESRYRRFFAFKSHLTEEELRYLTEVDGVDHLAIAAGRVNPDGSEEGLGVARFIVVRPQGDGDGAGDRVAEAAVAVVDDMQGRGLGSLLLQRLIAAAKERGVQRFRGEMLGSNRQAQEFFASLAPGAKTRYDEGVAVIEIEIPTLEPAHPHREPPRQSVAYRMFKAAAEGVLEMRRALSQLGRPRS